LRLTRAEEVLRGRPLDAAAVAEAAEASAVPARPMDNTDFSFLWRKEMTRRFVASALRGLA
jgi:CO/xanthine dehydrogenase FAD-binding subunit